MVAFVWRLINGWILFDSEPVWHVHILRILVIRENLLTFKLEEDSFSTEAQSLHNVKQLDWNLVGAILIRVSDDQICVHVGINEVGVDISPDRSFDANKEVLLLLDKDLICELDGRMLRIFGEVKLLKLRFFALRLLEPNNILRSSISPIL